jgi:hypothetical protein
MFIDPQSDVYAQYQQRKGDLNYPYRVNWEFQEQMRQHLMKTHAPDIINTTAFMNTPPSQFPQWTTPDLAQRQIPGTHLPDEEAPYYRDMQEFQDGAPQDDNEEYWVDEQGNRVDPTEEEKQHALSTDHPQDVKKETQTQYNVGAEI